MDAGGVGHSQLATQAQRPAVGVDIEGAADPVQPVVVDDVSELTDQSVPTILVPATDPITATPHGLEGWELLNRPKQGGEALRRPPARSTVQRDLDSAEIGVGQV